METMKIEKKDEIVMKLVHYFVTEENYSPIIVNGTKNEVWLENIDGPYNIIRINSNYIHNEEQLKYDSLKTDSVVKQIKAKTMALRVTTLNILLDVHTNINLNSDNKHINFIKINNAKSIKTNPRLIASFPNIKDKIIDTKDKLNFIVNVTKDINEKTEKNNKIYEETFKPKPVIFTKVLIALNVIIYLWAVMSISIGGIDVMTKFAINPYYVIEKNEWYRLLTGIFLHSGLIHLFFNSYALHIIGSQMEQYLGKWKFLFVYITSGILGSLFSIVITNSWSVGASGAIFGLLGSLLYFGYHYRLILGNVLKTQIIPIVLFNLAIGFVLPNIDIAAHFGGLFVGILSTMIVGIKGKTKLRDQINGLICLLILIGFLLYLILR